MTHINTDHLSLAPGRSHLRTCEHCHYQRQQEDNAPAWVCPACGLSYGTQSLALDERGQFYATRLDRNPANFQTHVSPQMRQRKRKKTRNKFKRFAITMFAIALAGSIPLQIQWYQSMTHKAGASSKPASRQVIDDQESFAKLRR